MAERSCALQISDSEPPADQIRRECRQRRLEEPDQHSEPALPFVELAADMPLLPARLVNE